MFRGRMSKRKSVYLSLPENTSRRHLVLMSLQWTDFVKMMKSLTQSTVKLIRRRKNQKLMIMLFLMSLTVML